jgi:cytochrome c biogenesis protein CcmG, thiol:disulfide interchange protein DsbE
MSNRSGASPYRDLSNRTSGGGPSRKGLVIGGVALLVVALLAVVAVVLSGDDGASDVEAVQEVAPIEVSGEPLPAYASGGDDPAIGMTAAALSGQDFEGEQVTIEPGDGTAKVLVFLAHWCPHCQAEVPVIQGWVDDGNLPDDVELFAVSTAARSDQPNYPPSEWLAREGWSGGIVLDDADTNAAAAFGLTSYPYLVFVDADGRVVQRAAGELPVEDFSQMVQELSAS